MTYDPWDQFLFDLWCVISDFKAEVLDLMNFSGEIFSVCFNEKRQETLLKAVFICEIRLALIASLQTLT